MADFAKEIINLKADLEDCRNQLDAAIAANNGEEAEKLMNQAKVLNAQILQKEMAYEQSRANVDSNGREKDAAWKESHPFATIGEQAMAIRNVTTTGAKDDRLCAVNEAAGMNTGTGADGGYAVQQDFMVRMIDSAVAAGEISGRCSRSTVGENSNSVKLVGINESDNSETILGGVRGYWVEEAEKITGSKPKLEYVTIDLNTMAAMLYATHQMQRDAALLTSQIMSKVPIAMTRLLEGTIISGGTTGTPKSIMSSDALVTVDATATASEVLNTKDILKMRTRMLPTSANNAVWLMHPDLEEYLPQLNLQFGSNAYPVYLPPTGLSGESYSTLFAKPIIFTDQMAAAGSAGDIGYMDLSMYEILQKGSMQQDISIHMMFDTAQTAFRFLMDCGGAPMTNHTLKLKNSTISRSPFVVLGARGS